MQLDRAKILSLIEEGYLMVNAHPTLPLNIYNYTRKTQFEKYWNEYTLLSRGLVLDHDYNVIAHPFSKFFNFEEHKPEDIPNEKYEVYDKMDGSLGILFYYADQWHIATRGSFVSDQALRAKLILRNHDLSRLKKEYTHLFEIIYPENRIVVNYGEAEKLVLLGIIDPRTGHDFGHEYLTIYVETLCPTMEVVKKHEVSTIQELKARNLLNEEGYILRYHPSNFRMKVKFEDYCRLHSIITNVSTKDIWAYLKDGKELDELLDRTPDEFDDWVRDQVRILLNEYAELESQYDHEFKKIYREGISKKEFAGLAFETNVNSSILFKMYDGKPYDHILWKMIEPEWSKPFYKQDDEE